MRKKHTFFLGRGLSSKSSLTPPSRCISMWLTLLPYRCISMWCDAVISILQSQTLPLTNLQVPICLDCTFVFIKKNTFSVFATTLSFQVFWLFLFRDWRSIQRPGAPAADQALSYLNWRSTWTSISWRLAWTSTVRNGSRKRKWIWSRSWTKTKLWQRHSMAKTNFCRQTKNFQDLWEKKNIGLTLDKVGQTSPSWEMLDTNTKLEEAFKGRTRKMWFLPPV